MGSIELSPQEKLNELRLYVNDSSQIRRTLIFVEGISDIRFYRKLFNSTNTRVELVPSGGGRPPVELLVNEWRADDNLHDRIIAILDADFTKILDPNYKEDPIFLTDGHDLEMMLLSHEEVFSAITNYYALDADSEFIRNLVHTLLQDISLVKLMNVEKGYQMKCKDFGFTHLFDLVQNSTNIDDFIKVAIAKGGKNCTITTEAVKDELLAFQAMSYDENELTNGHDFVKTLTHVFKVKYGHKELKYTAIESAIQIAYTNQHFKMTHLYQKLQAWQANHAVEILIA